MILVTGAAGKTGQALLRTLAQQPEPVRAWVHRPDQANTVRALGAQETVLGDLQDGERWGQALRGIRAVHHICPNMHPGEIAIGQLALDAARAAAVEHFVYHSVLHPQTEEMPHHWRKLRVEEMILAGDLPFTILQPAAYMQNILASWPRIVEEGIYAVPYAITARLAIVDLEDVAQAAATVLTQPGHAGAIYELAGPENLSQVEVAQVLAEALGHPVEALETPLEEWEANARRAGLRDYAIATLLAMFRYYARHGLMGNGNVLGWLLGRRPTTLAQFVQRQREGSGD